MKVTETYIQIFFDRVCLGLLESREMLDLLAQRETLVHSDLLAYRGLQETKDLLARRDLQA